MQFPRTFRSAQSKVLLLSFCIAAAVPAARADDASHRAKAEEMLRLTKTDTGLKDQLTNLQTRIGELSKQQFNLPTPTAEQTALLTEYRGKVQQITTEEVGYEQLRPMLVNLYATSFTDAELDGIIAFYKTPAGQSLVAKMPEIAGKTTGTVQERIKELQPKLAAVTQSYAEKLKLTPPAGAAPTPAAPSLNGPKAPAKP
jgi:hypothetical protein